MQPGPPLPCWAWFVWGTEDLEVLPRWAPDLLLREGWVWVLVKIVVGVRVVGAVINCDFLVVGPAAPLSSIAPGLGVWVSTPRPCKAVLVGPYRLWSSPPVSRDPRWRRPQCHLFVPFANLDFCTDI